MVCCLSIGSRSHTGRMRSASSQNHNRSTHRSFYLFLYHESLSLSLSLSLSKFLCIVFCCVSILACQGQFLTILLITGQVFSHQVIIITPVNIHPIITFIITRVHNSVVSIPFNNFIMLQFSEIYQFSWSMIIKFCYLVWRPVQRRRSICCCGKRCRSKSAACDKVRCRECEGDRPR